MSRTTALLDGCRCMSAFTLSRHSAHGQNAQDPDSARTLPSGVPPMVGAIMWVALGLFLIVGGIVLIAVLTALDLR